MLFSDYEIEQQKYRQFLKNSRKRSNNGPTRVHSITQFKSDFTNQSKEQSSSKKNHNNGSGKLELKNVRSVSGWETPGKTNSKSGFKLQLGIRK